MVSSFTNGSKEQLWNYTEIQAKVKNELKFLLIPGCGEDRLLFRENGCSCSLNGDEPVKQRRTGILFSACGGNFVQFCSILFLRFGSPLWKMLKTASSPNK